MEVSQTSRQAGSQSVIQSNRQSIKQSFIQSVSQALSQSVIHSLAWRMLLVYTSVTLCVCTSLLFRERHGFGATAQGKTKEGTNKAQLRHRKDTFLALFRTV